MDITYPEVLAKVVLGKNLFLCKISCKTPFGFSLIAPQRYINHISKIPSGIKSTFLKSAPPRCKYLFKTSFLENIDTILATWPFNRPYPRTRLLRNSFTLQRLHKIHQIQITCRESSTDCTQQYANIR